MHRTPLAVALLLICGACTESPAPVTPPDGPAPHAAGVRLSEALVTRGVGADCVECHAEIVASYADTSAMHDSITLPTDPDAPEAGVTSREVENEHTGAISRFVKSDGGYRQQMLLRGDDGRDVITFDAPVDLAFGSGHAARSYAAVVGETILMLPLSWYAELGDFAPSPGPGFRDIAARPMTRLCVTCHTGTAPPADARADAGFRGEIQLGIGCDRCHGDPAEHSLSGDPHEIVNPARLSIERQTEVCAQCHLSTSADFLVPGRDLSTYVPGTPLRDVLGVFAPVDAGADDGATIASHGTRLQRSLCFTASPEQMTCTTCHNPHRGHGDSATKADSAAGCNVCHQSDDCGEAHGARDGKSCASCHMARVPSSDIDHTSITDHWIRKRPVSVRSDRRPEDRSLGAHALADRPLQNLFDRTGEGKHTKLLLAHAYLRGDSFAHELFRQGSPAYLRRGEALIDELLAEDPDDVEALWRKSWARRAQGERVQAFTAIKRATELAPDHPLVLAERGRVESSLERDTQAVEFFTKAAAEMEDNTRVHVELAISLERAGRGREALDVLVAHRDLVGPRLDLATVSLNLALRIGDRERALSFVRDARTLRPRDPGLRAEEQRLLDSR